MISVIPEKYATHVLHENGAPKERLYAETTQHKYWLEVKSEIEKL